MSTENFDIIFIRPYGTGKSSVARLVVDQLNLTLRSLDETYYHYLRQFPGYNSALENEIGNWDLVSPLRQPYDLFVVEKFLTDRSLDLRICTLELGVSHSLYKDRIYLDRIKRIFMPYPNIFLLIPSPDIEESLSELLRRIRLHGIKGRNLSDEAVNQINRYALEVSSNYELAKFIIHTKGKSPEETAKNVLEYTTINLP